MDDDRIGTGLYREPPDWLEGNVLLEQDARRKARAERQAAARRGLCGEENDDVRALLDGVVTLYFEFVVPSATHSWGAALRLEHQDLTVLSDLGLEDRGFCRPVGAVFWRVPHQGPARVDRESCRGLPRRGGAPAPDRPDRKGAAMNAQPDPAPNAPPSPEEGLPGAQKTAGRTERLLWTVRDLYEADLPEPTWVVPGLLPVGLTLLAGRPKLGKSWLALQLAVAVGGGRCPGRFLDRPVPTRSALYIPLEDSPRRMRARLKSLVASPDCNLRLITAWQPLNTKGLDLFRRILAATTPGLVVIDTLTRAFSGHIDWDAVGQATEALGRVQSLAMEHDCAILLVDHHRKGNGSEGDVVDDVMGSTGKSAVADVVWGLYRRRGDSGATLRVTGRDLEEASLGLTFHRETCSWQVAQDADGVKPGSVQEAILEALDDLHGEGTVAGLAAYLQRAASNVSRELKELQAKGLVRRKSSAYGAPYVLVQKE